MPSISVAIAQGRYAPLTPPLTTIALSALPALGNTLVLVVGGFGGDPQPQVTAAGLVWAPPGAGLGTAMNGDGALYTAVRLATLSAIPAAVTVTTAAGVPGFLILSEWTAPPMFYAAGSGAGLPPVLPVPATGFSGSVSAAWGTLAMIAVQP